MSEKRSLRGLIGVALFGLTCAQPAEMETRFHDLVTSPERVSHYEARGPKKIFCSDQTHFAWILMPTGQLSAPIDFGDNPKLEVSGCLSESTDPASEEVGELEILAETLDGRTVSDRIEVRASDGWWRHEIDLRELAHGPGRVRVHAQLPRSRSLFVKDLFVSHATPAPPRSSESRQVLLISLDTFRAEAIAALGGSNPTPALDQLIADSQVWASHYSAAAMTKPGHASLLTGHHAWLHGALQDENPIRPQVVTLAQRFRERGFRTAGLVYDAVWLDSKFGFSRGFDEYRAVTWSLSQMFRSVSNWTSENRSEPFFLFFHTFEAHSDFNRLPYEAPGVTTEMVRAQFSVAGYGCRDGACASNYLQAINDGAEPLPREAEILRFLYGESITHLDSQLGRLFDHLKSLGIYDGMMIVLTADHGEAFLENGDVLHGLYWEEVIRVPLIIKWPGGRSAGQRVDTPSSGIDVAPTLLKTLGLPYDDLPGSFLPERNASEPVYIATGWSAVIADGLKWVDVTNAEGKRGLFFDLGRDTGEEIGDEHPEQVERLKHLLAKRVEIDEQALQRLDRVTPSSFSKEEIEQLEALGYLE
jgi:hypothetical protein